jgi:ammonium transporter, Amt family
LTNNGGAIDGNGRQVWVQIVGALFIIGWNVVWTSLIMLFIKYVCRVPLRMSEEACRIGDYAVHQEESYTFAYYNRGLLRSSSRLGSTNGGEDLEPGIGGLIMGRAVEEAPRHTGVAPGHGHGGENGSSAEGDGEKGAVKKD